MDIPKGFNFPVYTFQLFNYDHPLQVTTPYGILPDRAIAADNSKCFFQNVYFFNAGGQATKYEAVLNIHLSPDEEEDRSLIKLNIIPYNNKSRYVSLDEADLKKIERVLSLIEFGKLNDKNIGYS